ncbi:MAG: transcriptional regulator, LysR family [Acidimicrobiia bacterium]|nr:transcriptional regulator, LysR family [Acidimicrobiia bacterium]
MELRQVAHAIAVVDAGGFNKAAAAVYVSQPALSESVARLEAELGVALFERIGRGVTLTAAGEAFLVPARQLLADVTTIRAAVDAVRGVDGGRLDLVCLPTLAVDPVAHIVGLFRSAHPHVEVRVHEPEDADAAARFVLEGRAEIGFAEWPPPGGLDGTVLFEQEILAVCPPGTRQSKRKRLAIEALASMPLVTTPPGTSTRRLLDAAVGRAGIHPSIAVQTAHREALVPLVLTGAGTTFLPGALAVAAELQGAVVFRLDPPVTRQVGLMYRRGSLAPATVAFLDVSRRLIAAPRRRRGRETPPA